MSLHTYTTIYQPGMHSVVLLVVHVNADVCLKTHKKDFYVFSWAVLV